MLFIMIGTGRSITHVESELLSYHYLYIIVMCRIHACMFCCRSHLAQHWCRVMEAYLVMQTNLSTKCLLSLYIMHMFLILFIFTGHSGSIPYADKCGSIKIRFQELIQNVAQSDLYWSALIGIGDWSSMCCIRHVCWPIVCQELLKADQF